MSAGNDSADDSNNDYEDYTTYSDYKAGVVIWKVIPPIIIAFGTIGNILSIVVLTRKAIRTSTTAVYLTVLAFSDLVVLYTGLLRQWLNYLFETDVRHISSASCKIHMWLVYVSLDFSAWILMAVTLERVISAWCPHRAKSTCTKKSALSLMGGILVFLLSLNAHILYGMGDVVGSDGVFYKCGEIDINYSNFFNLVWPWIDFCVFCLMPFGVLLIGNVCILLKVFASQRKTKARVVPQSSGQRSVQTKVNSNKKSSMTAMLFTLNVVFLVSTTPVSIYNIGYPHWRDGTAATQANLDLWWAVVNMFMYVNNSMNFLLYCLSGSRFRMEVRKMFCSSRASESTTRAPTPYTRTQFNQTRENNGNQGPGVSGNHPSPARSNQNLMQISSVA